MMMMIQDSYRSKEMQGIVSILGSDSERTKMESNSLRRTLSADMSSKKWIYHMKKVASSAEISVTDSDDDDDEKVGMEIWNSFQGGEKMNKEATQNEIWTSIVSQKDVNSSKSVSPYVHPLVKRSASSLSEQSLEICTESLGSETGSDGFSSYSPSENGGDDEKGVNQEDETQTTFEKEEEEKRRPPVKYNNYKKSAPKSFPPPLISLSNPDGGSLRMQSRRDNGRLVLEATSVPSPHNFHAKRQDGRLVLTLVKPQFVEQVASKNEKQKDEKESEEDKAQKDQERVIITPELPNRLLNVHRLTAMMNSKSIVLANNKHHNHQSTPPAPPITQYSLPPRPNPSTAAAAAASLNSYEYYWRSKATTTKAGMGLNPLGVGQQVQSLKHSSRKFVVCKNRTANEQHNHHQSSLVSNCKEIRRSLLFWEPHCIATS